MSEQMEIIDNKCVNSKWVARFLAGKDQECCECYGSCKVKVKHRGYTYILTEQEINNLKKVEST